MITDPRTCNHPHKYKMVYDIREYCPDCMQYLYPNFSEYFGGVDPATDADPLIFKKNSDGTMEQIK